MVDDWNADVRLSILNDSISASREALGADLPALYPGAAFVSVSSRPGDDEGDWDLLHMPGGPSTWCEQRCLVLDNIQGLVIRVGLWPLQAAWMSSMLSNRACMTVSR